MDFLLWTRQLHRWNRNNALGNADANVSLHPMEQVETVFLSVPSHMQELLLHTFEQSDLFAGQILTIVRTCNGLLIYTEGKKQLLSLLNRLINQ